MTKKKHYLTLFVLWMLTYPRYTQGQIPLTVHLEDQNFTSGIHEFQAYDSVTMANVNIEGDVDVTLRSLNIIILHPGVNISQGANFQAYGDYAGNLSLFTVSLYNEGVALLNIGDFDGAIAKFEQILELDPGFLPVYFPLGMLYFNKGEYATSTYYLEKFLELATTDDPNVVRAHYLAWQAYMQLGNEEAADFHFMQLPPEFLIPELYNEGLKLFESGDINGAIQKFKEVLEIDPNHAHAHYRLGVCYVNTGETALARYHLERFLELAPDDPEAGTAKEMLSYLQ